MRAISRNRIATGDSDWPQQLHSECIEWLAANGFDVDTRYIYAIEVGIMDCPFVRVEWIWRGKGLDTDDLRTRYDDDGKTLNWRVSEIPMRVSPPSWWQPEVLA